MFFFLFYFCELLGFLFFGLRATNFLFVIRNDVTYAFFSQQQTLKGQRKTMLLLCLVAGGSPPCITDGVDTGVGGGGE